MTAYYEISGLENTYLEDSFVLEIEESSDELTFLLDLVLTEEHSRYSIPAADEQYCYKKAFLKFKKCEVIDWIEKTSGSFTDSNGEIDHGNIDSFTRDGKENHLSGDWGELIVVTDLTELSFV